MRRAIGKPKAVDQHQRAYRIQTTQVKLRGAYGAVRHLAGLGGKHLWQDVDEILDPDIAADGGLIAAHAQHGSSGREVRVVRESRTRDDYFLQICLFLAHIRILILSHGRQGHHHQAERQSGSQSLSDCFCYKA